MPKIKTFADACRALKISTDQLTDVSLVPPRFRVQLNAHYKLMVITEALNEGWKPDWDNGDEYKWYPWFYLNKPGFRFGGAYYALTNTYTGGGSRLCFKSEELAKYAGKQFINLYKQLLK